MKINKVRMIFSSNVRFSRSDMSLFCKMDLVLQEAERFKKKFGRPHNLAIEDQLLLTLKYL